MILSIHDTIRAAERSLQLKQREIMPAAVRAVNGAATTTRGNITGAAKPAYPGMKVGQLRARVEMKRATRAKPTAVLEVSGKPIHLHGRFGMRGRGQRDRFGVQFNQGKMPWKVQTLEGVPVDGTLLQRAFRNRLRASGRAVVFTRLTEERDSHRILVAPGIAVMLRERGQLPGVRTAAAQRLQQLAQREVRFILNRRAAGG